jgi:acetate kinase
MRVAAVNAGSSSLKLSVVEADDTVSRRLDIERWDGEDETDELRAFLADAGPVDAVAHRVVHGGETFTGPVVVDDDVIRAIGQLSELAPLHQPRALAGMRAVRAVLPDAPGVACFDTAFHRSMPERASTYALPAEWRQRWPLRRFGFHGLSHASAARHTAALLARPLTGLRIVTCHLGAGASLSAVEGGRSVDTTMGFTPLEGLVMATRSGSLDPGLVLWLIEHGLTPAEVRESLEHRSGLAGLTGGSGDMRDVLAAAEQGERSATLALDVYIHRLCSGIAAMIASLGGADAVTFTGGVGEHAHQLRADVATRLGYLGIAVDQRANEQARGDAEISAAQAPVRTVVVTAREDSEMARQARAVARRRRPLQGRGRTE